MDLDENLARNPRKDLEEFYGSAKGVVPAELRSHRLVELQRESLNRISARGCPPLSDGGDDQDFSERKIISEVLGSSRYSSQEKEYISASILKGNFSIDIRTAEDSSIVARRKKKQGEAIEKAKVLMNMQRHDLRPLNFLQVQPKSQPIPRLRRREVLEERLCSIRQQSPFASTRNLQPDRMEDAAGDRVRSASSLPAPSGGGTSGGARGMQPRDVMSKIREEKQKNVQKIKQETRDNREQAQQLRQQEREAVIHKAQIKKRLGEFRQKLKLHLLQKGEPLMGSIMRMVDESMIYHFMEKYEGYSMTADAILTFLGESLGPSLLTPDPIELAPGSAETRGRRVVVVEASNAAPLHGEFDPSLHLLNRISGDIYYPPRQRSREQRPPRTSSPERTIGGGFRMRMRSRSPSPDNKGGVNGSLSVQALSRDADTKGYRSLTVHDPSIPNNAVLDPLEDPIYVIREQMIREDRLPSMSPERVMSEEHLRDLGTGASSFEDIANDVLEQAARAQRRPVTKFNSPVPKSNDDVVERIRRRRGLSSKKLPQVSPRRAASEKLNFVHDLSMVMETEGSRDIPPSSPWHPSTIKQVKSEGVNVLYPDKRTNYEHIRRNLQSQDSFTDSLSVQSVTTAGGSSVNTQVGIASSIVGGYDTDIHRPGDTRTDTGTGSRSRTGTADGSASGVGRKKVRGILSDRYQQLQQQNQQQLEAQPVSALIIQLPDMLERSVSFNYRGKLLTPVNRNNQQMGRSKRIAQNSDLGESRRELTRTPSRHVQIIDDTDASTLASTVVERGEAVERVQLVKPPRQLKTRLRNISRDGLDNLPVNPYQSYAESKQILNAGVPAGMGLPKFMPRGKTRDGRFRAGLTQKEVELRTFSPPPFM